MAIDEQLEIKSNLSGLIDSSNFQVNSYLQAVSQKLPGCKLNDEISFFKLERSSNLVNQDLCINKHFTIILFNPLGGKMLKDYDEVLRHDYHFPTIDTIKIQTLDNQVFKQDQVFEINHPLNLIQKLCIANSQIHNVLIYGPPGTGKSEVVANLIANAILNNKTICAISEKKAALDVIDERLKDLNVLSMSAFNEQNQAIFYKKIKEISRLISSSNPTTIRQNNHPFLKIIEYFQSLDNLVDFVDSSNRNIIEVIPSIMAIDEQTFNKYQMLISELFILTKQSNFDLEKFKINVFNIRIIFSEMQKIFPNAKLHNNFFNKELIKDF